MQYIEARARTLRLANGRPARIAEMGMNISEVAAHCAALVGNGKLLQAAELSRDLFKSGDRPAAKHAADTIRDSIAATSNNLAELFNLYVDLDSWELAEQVAIRLFVIDPNHIDVRRGLTKLYITKWKLDKTREQLTVFLSLPDIDADDILFAARIYLRFATCADAEVAQQLIKRVFEITGKASFPDRTTLAKALLIAGRRHEAVRQVKNLQNAACTPIEFAMLADLFVRLRARNETLEMARLAAAADGLRDDGPHVKISIAEALLRVGFKYEAQTSLLLVDHAEIDGIWMLRRFHDACYEAQLYDEALVTARRLKLMLPDVALFPQRIAFCSMALPLTKSAMVPSPPKKTLFSTLFGKR